jgi:hypothetical protein
MALFILFAISCPAEILAVSSSAPWHGTSFIVEDCYQVSTQDVNQNSVARMPDPVLAEKIYSCRFGVSMPIQRATALNGRVSVLDGKTKRTAATHVLRLCLDAPGAALIDPTDIIEKLGYSLNSTAKPIDIGRDVKISVLQQPAHGIIGLGVVPYEPEAYGYWVTERNADGLPSYTGVDSVVLSIGIQGASKKVVVIFMVSPQIDETKETLCKPVLKKKAALL